LKFVQSINAIANEAARLRHFEYQREKQAEAFRYVEMTKIIRQKQKTRAFKVHERIRDEKKLHAVKKQRHLKLLPPHLPNFDMHTIRPSRPGSLKQ